MEAATGNTLQARRPQSFGASERSGASAAGDSPGGREVEVTGAADDDRVELLPWSLEEPQLRKPEAGDCSDAGAPVLPASLPNADVVLLDLHSGSPEAGDHLCVTRVVALVGTEVEDAHYAKGPATRSSGAPGLLPAESVSSTGARVCADFVSRG